MKVSDGQLKMYRPITAFELVLFDGRTITVGFATPEEVSSLKWSVMSMLPNAECVEDGSIDRKACRKLNWDFKKSTVSALERSAVISSTNSPFASRFSLPIELAILIDI